MLKEDLVRRNDGQARITRRDFLRIGGLTVLGSALAACGAAAPATPAASTAPTAAAPAVLKGATVKYLAGPWSFLPELDTVIESFGNDWAKQNNVTISFERHRGAEFAALTTEVLDGLRAVFGTRGAVVIYTASGTGAIEAAFVNTLSPGDRVLIFETGYFSNLWRQVASSFGLDVDYAPGDWRHGASVEDLEARLRADEQRTIKAVVVVHNETSTGVTSRIADLRRAMNRLAHPALLMVDTVSSLASMDYRHDEWEVDVTACGSQKGLMVPPGLSFNAISEKAIAAGRQAKLPRQYWDWTEMIKQHRSGYFAYTPATNLLFGLREALAMLQEEGLPQVFARHDRHAEATRAAVRAWGLEIVCADPREYSSSLTAVFTPEGHSADRLRRTVLDQFDMSLGTGLGQLADRAFRIGHLGSFNDLMLAGTLAGVEMGLRAAGVPHREGGVTAALRVLAPEPVKASASIG